MNPKIKQPAYECSYSSAANLRPGISKCRVNIYILMKVHCLDVEKIVSSLSRTKAQVLIRYQLVSSRTLYLLLFLLLLPS